MTAARTKITSLNYKIFSQEKGDFRLCGVMTIPAEQYKKRFTCAKEQFKVQASAPVLQQVDDKGIPVYIEYKEYT